MFCPNIYLKSVTDDFNSVVVALGGNPLTDDEFKSAELRKQRTGLDKSAAAMAYLMFDRNNGYPVSMAPNGKKSILFQQLEERFGREEAIRIKSTIYDIGENKVVDKLDDMTDVNGEPLMEYVLQQKNTASRFGRFSTESTLGESTIELNQGKAVSSVKIMSEMVSKKLFSPRNTRLADILTRHDIPIRFDNLPGREVARAIELKDGGTVIVIDQANAAAVSNQFLADTILHEIIHACTVKAINTPVTEIEKKFTRSNREVFKLLDKAFPKDQYSRYDVEGGYYILKNEKEFAAVYLTDRNARLMMLQKAMEVDKKRPMLIRALRNFINAFTKFLVNKELFKDNVQKLQEYEKVVNDYLVSMPTIDKGNIALDKALKIVYDNIDEETLANEQLILQERLIDAQIEVLEYNPMLNVNVTSSSQTSNSNNKIRSKFSDIADALTSRLLSVKVSDLPQEYKVRQQEILEAQIQQFRSNQMSSFAVISSLLSQIKPQIKEDLNAIKAVYRDGTRISPTVYMYQRHDNFGTYQKVLQDIQELLIEPGIMSLLVADLNNNGQQIQATELINRLKTNIADCISITHEGETYMKSIKGMIVKDLLQKIGQATHSPTMGKYLDELEKIGYDTSAWFLYAGSADKAKDDGLRALAYMVNKALNKADRKSNALSIKLLVLLDKLKAGESVQDLYELDDKGKTTGYMVRKRNYGLFYKDYNEFLANLNLGKVGYTDSNGITKYIKNVLDPKNRIAPDDEEDRIIWNLAKIQWLSKRADKKYLPKYYEAYSKLSYLAAEKREAIQSKIRILRANVTDENGNFHMEDMTPDDYRKYKQYIQERRILTGDYDINGHKKDRGSVAWKIAKELQQLNEDLYGDKNADYTYDEERWNSDRNSFIAKKVREGMSEQQAREMFDSRASKRRLKKNKEGKSLLFEQINKEFKERTGIDRDSIRYDQNGQYQKNKEEIQNLLSPYFDANLGEYSSDMVPAAIQERVKELEQQNRDIKRAAASNPSIAEYNKIYQEIFQKYATSAPTQAYIQMKQEYEAVKYANFAQQVEEEDFFMDDLDDLFDPFVEATEYVTAFWDDGTTITQRYRWFNAIKPLPEYEDEFVEYLPGDQYIINDNAQSLLNPHFDESENMSMVPRLDYDNGRYDNSTAYNKIINSPELNALYVAVHDAIQESNEQFKNKQWHDDYLLPQMTGSYYKRLKNQESKAHASWEYLKDTFGILEQQNTEFGMSLQNALNNVDELGEAIMSQEYSGGSNVSARRPNGRQLNIIPQYYTKKLEDPSQISADLIGIVCEYYRQAYRYSEKQSIKDSCEAIVDMMEDREYESSNRFSAKRKSKKSTSTKGSDSNTFKVARKFLDMNLYNIRNQRYEYNVFGYDINLGKAASLFRTFTVALNLGMNIAVAATGFFTASYAHIINSIVGVKYGVKESHQAGVEVMWHMLENGMGAKYIGDKTTKDKVMLLAELYNLSSQGTRKYEHSNRNRTVNVLWDNWCFGMLTSQDFIIKSQIMVSTLMSFRYYNGHFITREDLLNNMYNATPEEYTKELAKWEDADSVYSAMYVDGYHIEIEDKYKNAYKEVENVLHNRIQKYSESADGMATETQKAAITTNFLGAAVLTHRQYLPLMLTERFGEMVWDMDTQQYTGGIARTGFHYLFNILGMFVKDLIVSHSLEKSINNYKTKYDQYFNDYSTIESAAISNAHKQHLKQIISEQLVFWGFITPVVGLLAALADDDDNKDKLALQLAVYIARRTQWETYTPYRFEDLFNNIKTVSAQTGTIDKIGSLGTQVVKYITPSASLYDTFLGSGSQRNINDDIIQRGVYKDWTRFDKAFFQMFPIHNLYEQWYGSKDKRKYYENQIMNK